MHGLIRRGAMAGVVGALAVSGVASARPGDRSFTQTYPVASSLCANVAAGHVPKGLAGSVPKVNQACAALGSAYSAALAPALSAEQAFRAGNQAARLQARQTCLQAHAVHQPKVCRQARRQAHLTVRADRLVRRAAVLRYRIAIESARRTFWSTIHALRGGADIKADAPKHDASVPTS